MTPYIRRRDKEKKGEGRMEKGSIEIQTHCTCRVTRRVRWKKICKQGDTVGEEIGSDDDEE
jgi:hypothetical protein